MANPPVAWKRFCGRLVLLLLLWQTQKIQVALADAPKDPPSSSSSASSLLLDNEDCNVFLAESSLPNAGRGVFVTRHYKRGEKIVSAGSSFWVMVKGSQFCVIIDNMWFHDSLLCC